MKKVITFILLVLVIGGGFIFYKYTSEKKQIENDLYNQNRESDKLNNQNVSFDNISDFIQNSEKVSEKINNLKVIPYLNKNYVNYSIKNLYKMTFDTLRGNCLKYALNNLNSDYKKKLNNVKDISELMNLNKRQISNLKNSKLIILNLKKVLDKNTFKKYLNIIQKSNSKTVEWMKFNNKLIFCLNKSRKILKQAFNKIDTANNKLKSLGQYASSNEIINTYYYWENAKNKVESAKNALIDNSFSYTQRQVANRVFANENNKLNNVLRKVKNHTNLVYSKYQQAKRDESTSVGRAKRSAGKLWERAKSWGRKKMNQASQTRIGKEIKLSTKTLILGSKIMYDMMGNNNGDLMGMAMSYEKDVNQLMKETEEIQSMDEASITGKNTFIEDLVNKGYENSFK